MSDQQPILAAVLSAVFPGLGHAYLGAWGRSLVWLSTVIAAGTLLLYEAGLDPGAYETVGPLARAVVTGFSPLGVISLVLLMSANVLDAFRVGQRAKQEPLESGPEVPSDGDRPEGEVQTCPECGKPVDADLDFCHWCTEEFEK